MRPVKDKYLRLALELAIASEEVYLDSWKNVDDEGGEEVRKTTRHNIRMFKRRLGLKEDGR